MSHGTCMDESWHIHKCAMSHVWMSHGTCMHESWHNYKCLTSCVWMRHVTCTNESCHMYEQVTWLASPTTLGANHILWARRHGERQFYLWVPALFRIQRAIFRVHWARFRVYRSHFRESTPLFMVWRALFQYIGFFSGYGGLYFNIEGSFQG